MCCLTGFSNTGAYVSLIKPTLDSNCLLAAFLRKEREHFFRLQNGWFDF